MKLYLCTHCGRKIPRADLLEHRKSCSPAAEFAEKKGFAGYLGAGFKNMLKAGAALLLAFLSLLLGQLSFESLTEMRRLERIPATRIHAILAGEVNLTGKAVVGGQVLSAPRSSTPCVYYRYLVERKERDSDGDTRWVTVTDRQEQVPFNLEDDTGRVMLYPDANVDFNVRESYSTTEGDLRYTEYRIDLGSELFVFGYAAPNLEGLEIRFDVEGHYKPIVSQYGEQHERSKMAGGSIALCWLGLVALAFVLWLLVSLLRIHHLLVYFSLLNSAVALYLVLLGLHMMKMDLRAARERLTRHEETARAAIQAEIPLWDGSWESLPDDDALIFRLLSPAKRERVQRIRLDLALAVERARRQREAFPERLLASGWGVPPYTPLPMPETLREQIALDRLSFAKAKVPPLAGWLILGASALVGSLCYGFGFRRVRFKRCMENLPTSPSTGVAYGLSELKGVVELAPGVEALHGPLSAQPCVQYHYTIREKRGSGKKSKWVTILDESRRHSFLCRDADGFLQIDPTGAVIYTDHRTSRHSGNRRYSETRLELGDPLYAIGEAVIDPARGDRLQLTKPSKTFPFILSNFTERRIMLHLAFTGILLLNISFAAILLAALVLFGLSGAFAATDYLAAALTAPFFMSLVTLTLHYNDLVFLRERVRRNRANIDVSLKKRHDLLPMLEETAKALRAHEASLQEHLAAMRTLYQNPSQPGGDPQEAAVLGQLLLNIEAYPDLKAQPLFAMLMRSMIVLENEVSMMRKGLNDAVETYNTRIQTLPDLIFAKLFHFVEEPMTFAENEIIRIPPAIQDLWEKKQVADAPVVMEEEEEGLPAAVSPAPPAPLPPPQTVDLAEAKATLCALLLDANVDIRERQRARIREVEGEVLLQRVDALAEALPADENDFDKLRHAESGFSALKTLSKDAFLSFGTLLLDLMEADEEIKLFEYALHQSIRANLETAFGLNETPPMRHRDYAALFGSISSVLSSLAHADADAAANAQRVFESAVAAINHKPTSDFTMLSKEACGIAALDAALEELSHAGRMIRANLLYACDAAVGKGEITSDQMLLLCAMADALRLPRPR